MIQMDIHKHGPSWRMRFKDPSGKPRKFRLARSKRVSDSMANKVALLVEHVHAQSPISEELVEFVLSLDPDRQQKLKDWGVVDADKVAPLATQIDLWEKGILNRGRAEAHATKQKNRVKLVFDTASFNSWQEIDAEKVLQVLDDWRAAGKLPSWKKKNDLTETTLTHYLKACKAFTRWVVRSGYRTKDPLVLLEAESRQQEARKKPSTQSQRRALTQIEQDKIVKQTRGMDHRFGMSGSERSLLYHTALRTGLRASAIRRLRAADIHKDGTLNATSGGARNKKTAPKPVCGKLLVDLLAHAESKPAGDSLFKLPNETNMARMLQADTKEAGIPVAGVDFHCLRHTFCTEVGRVVGNVKTAQRLMDHSSVQMTMRYMHSWPEDEVAAIERLPEIGGGEGEAQPRPTERPTVQEIPRKIA